MCILWCSPGSRSAGSESFEAGGACLTYAGVSGNAPVNLSQSPSICSNRDATLSVPLSGPKPGIALASLKSHWLSAMPMKSRMAGSLTQARRSAARVNSPGTRLCRNARMSLSTVIASIDSRLDGSKETSATSLFPSRVEPGLHPTPHAIAGTLHRHYRQWPRNTGYQTGATPYLCGAFTGRSQQLAAGGPIRSSILDADPFTPHGKQSCHNHRAEKETEQSERLHPAENSDQHQQER